MAKCKKKGCACKARICSDVVQNMKCHCMDVCSNPICDSPKYLSLMAPLIYDEIGINLCASTTITPAILTTYPTASKLNARVTNVTFADDSVTIEPLAGRPNCYSVTLTNLTANIAVDVYDNTCRLLGTINTTIVYLPSDETAPTADERTNPSSIELEIFAPYGVSVEAADSTEPVLNYIGFLPTNNYVRQGLNLHAIGKLLDYDIDDSTITVGLTLILQSLYFAEYRVKSEGKIKTPKGSIILPDSTSCLNFVRGDLLNLAIKPLELGPPRYEEQYKQDCEKESCGFSCGCDCFKSDTDVITTITSEDETEE